MSISLTEQEAYAAMFAFLEKFYESTQSDDVGGLLGGMSMLSDGTTADPAIWRKWLECVALAKQGSVNLKLEIG